MKAIGADIFAGGFSVGVLRHFDVLAHFEHGPYGAESVGLNLPEVKLHPDPKTWPRTPRYPGQRERTRYIYANPPCAPFSGASAGRATAWHEDPRLNCFWDCFQLLGDIQPDIMTIESVTNSWFHAGNFSRNLAREAAEHGYATTVLLHDAQFLGVPQVRKRVFYVFHKVAFTPVPPTFDKLMTIAQVFKGLKIPAASKKRFAEAVIPPERHHRWLRETPPGGRLAKRFNQLVTDPVITAEGRVKGRPSFLFTRLPWDRPCGVLMGGNTMFHPTENRSLYPEELHAVGTFPADWKWPERFRLANIAIQLSQGVMPKVGEWIAASVVQSIERGKRLNRPFLAVQDLRLAPGSYTILEEDLLRLPREVYTPPPMPEPKLAAPRRPRVESSGPGETIARGGSGVFIRGLLAEGKHSAAEIVELVHAKFPGSKATTADVSWNKRKLQLDGL